MIWLTSDQHFGHYLPALKRPFIGWQMDKLLIDNFNAKVKPEDETWIIGDFSLHSSVEQMKIWFNQLNGSKHLILGNHDKNNKVLKLGWASVHDTHMLSCNNKYIWLSHYSHRVWPSKHRGVMHCYGHSHGHLPGLDRSCDVGVDVPEWNYSPVSGETIIKKLEVI